MKNKTDNDLKPLKNTPGLDKFDNIIKESFVKSGKKVKSYHLHPDSMTEFDVMSDFNKKVMS